MSLFSKSKKPAPAPETKASLNLSRLTVAKFDPRWHVYNRFDCDAGPLNGFIRNKAVKATARREFAVYVATLDNSPNVIAYYALQVGSDAVPNKHQMKTTYLSTYAAFPTVSLAYLAVNRDQKRQGIGQFLLMHAFERVAEIADKAGLFGLSLQSYNKDSTAFYMSLEFARYGGTDEQPKLIYPLSLIYKLFEYDE